MISALVVGGTGVISTAVVQRLLDRGVNVTTFNRGLRTSPAVEGARLIRGDRANASEFARAFEGERFDVVYDMICYSPEDAEASVNAFAGRCEQLVFCSSAVVYGPKMPPNVLIDEGAPLEPTSHWGKSKVACEEKLMRASERGAFELTIARLGHTYGPGDSMNDQQENDSGTWDRVARGLPVFCAGDGLGLWQSTHRDDAAKFFAGAALAPQTYGQTFNVMRDEVLTWRDYYREVARALAEPPADEIAADARQVQADDVLSVAARSAAQGGLMLDGISYRNKRTGGGTLGAELRMELMSVVPAGSRWLCTGGSGDVLAERADVVSHVDIRAPGKVALGRGAAYGASSRLGGSGYSNGTIPSASRKPTTRASVCSISENGTSLPSTAYSVS
jgi:nucleoside-diphosphate-sugar epimerase